jgi:hypothetical protein
VPVKSGFRQLPRSRSQWLLSRKGRPCLRANVIASKALPRWRKESRGRTKSPFNVAELDLRIGNRLGVDPHTFDRMAFPDSIHFTAKTSTFAHVVPCGGTATKYSFSSGTNRPVLPSGPVGIFPMA